MTEKYLYRYQGDLPTVFTTLKKNGHTWVPSKGDDITSEELLYHPLLELVVPEKIDDTKEIETKSAKESNDGGTKNLTKEVN